MPCVCVCVILILPCIDDQAGMPSALSLSQSGTTMPRLLLLRLSSRRRTHLGRKRPSCGCWRSTTNGLTRWGRHWGLFGSGGSTIRKCACRVAGRPATHLTELAFQSQPPGSGLQAGGPGIGEGLLATGWHGPAVVLVHASVLGLCGSNWK